MGTIFFRAYSKDYWQVLNRLLLILVGICILVVIGLTFYPEIQRIKEMRHHLERVQESVAAEKFLLLQQQRELYWLETDPEYVEMLARDKFNLMKPEESIFRVEFPHEIHSVSPSHSSERKVPSK